MFEKNKDKKIEQVMKEIKKFNMIELAMFIGAFREYINSTPTQKEHETKIQL